MLEDNINVRDDTEKPVHFSFFNSYAEGIF